MSTHQYDSLRVVVVDDCKAFAEGLARALRGYGCWVGLASDFEQGDGLLCQAGDSAHLVSELKVAGVCLGDFFAAHPRLSAQRCAVVTAYPSVASAVQFTRMGFAGYLVKPASPEAVLSAVAGTPEPAEAADVSDLEWPSLDRTIWEYLNQVHAWAGSLSAAARHLRIDRRSLRRMLAKYPPVR